MSCFGYIIPERGEHPLTYKDLAYVLKHYYAFMGEGGMFGHSSALK